MVYKQYSQLKTLILKEIFKNKSTREFSKLMGFKFDKCKRWLDNSKILKWDEFTQLCKAANIDIDFALSAFNYTFVPSGPQYIVMHLKEINAFETNLEIADYLSCHPSVVQRHIIGKISPDVETVFKLIDKNSNMLATFIHRLFPNGIHDSELFNLIEKDVRAPIFEASHYLSSLIQACINIKSYGERNISSVKWLSQQLGNPEAEIIIALEEMLKERVVAFDGEDTYTVLNLTTNVGATTFQDTIPFYKALNGRLIQVLDKKRNDVNATPKPGIFGSRVYSASTVAMEKIRSVAYKTNSEILRILEEDEHERVDACCMLFQVFRITNEEHNIY